MLMYDAFSHDPPPKHHTNLKQPTQRARHLGAAGVADAHALRLVPVLAAPAAEAAGATSGGRHLPGRVWGEAAEGAGPLPDVRSSIQCLSLACVFLFCVAATSPIDSPPTQSHHGPPSPYPQVRPQRLGAVLGRHAPQGDGAGGVDGAGTGGAARPARVGGGLGPGAEHGAGGGHAGKGRSFACAARLDQSTI